MIEEIIKGYNIKGNLIKSEGNNSGIINTTYVLTFEEEGEIKKYLVQKINTSVFHEPYKLMKNIELVTSYLKKKVKRDGEGKHQTLEIVKTKNNSSLYQINKEDKSREYYRIYEYIDNAVSYDMSVDKEIVFNTGKAFGNFQKLLKDYPMNQLEETIKDFHHTEKRFKKFIEDIKIDPNGRAEDVAREILFILKRENLCSLITNKLENGTIPLRVTHNDTKVNNVLMNKEDNTYLAVIDLDTVMPGSLLYDYGDGIRSTCSNALEDETDLSKVFMNDELFEAYTDGFMSEMAEYMNESELDLMGESIRILTLELAIRFLNDYINGDTYFKTNYENHNLDRARNQIKLVMDIESKLEQINNYIEDSYKKYKNKNQGKKRILAERK